MSNRRQRRRRERARAKQPRRSRRFSVPERAGLVAGGVVLLVVGALLLGAGGTTNAPRLGRLAGIVIMVGLVMAVLGVLGKV